MPEQVQLWLARFALSMVLGLAAPPLAAANTVSANLERGLPWTEITYRARKLFLGGELTFRHAMLPSAQAMQAVSAPFEGTGLDPSGDTVVRIDVESSVPTRHSFIELYLDAQSGAVLQRYQRETGRKEQYKNYRFTDSGVARLRLEPEKGEERLPFADWSKRRENFRPYPTMDAPLVVTEPAALPFLIATSGLEAKGDVFTFHVFTDKRLVEVRAEAVGWDDMRFDFETEGRRIKERKDVLEVMVSGRTIDDGPEQGFDFFSLKEDLRIYVDVDRRLPVEITGVHELIGKLRFRVKEVRDSLARPSLGQLHIP